MRFLTLFTVSALIGLLAAVPISDDSSIEKLELTRQWYERNLVKYSAKHDIVDIAVPLNRLNFDEDVYAPSLLVFFVEADVQEDGSKVYQGLYSYKKGEVTKLLDNGTDVAALRGGGYDVYFGAKDGIYKYNRLTNSAEKYGTLTDSVIAIEVAFGQDILFILTEGNVVYRVTEAGTTKEKVEQIEDAKDIMLDYSNNFYFYADDKQLWMLEDGEEVKKIEGLPEITAEDEVALVRPPFVLNNGVIFTINNKVYIVRSDGKAEFTGLEFLPELVPTAYAAEATLAQFYALDKKLFEFNVLDMFANSALESLDDYLNKKTTEVAAITQKRGTLKRKLLKQGKEGGRKW